MHIQEGDHRFYIEKDSGEKIGEVTFRTRDDDVFIIDHTFVSPDYRGQKIAQQLIQAVVDKARTEKKKIIPVCSYAQARFARVKDYQDVLERP